MLLLLCDIGSNLLQISAGVENDHQHSTASLTLIKTTKILAAQPWEGSDLCNLPFRG